MKNSIKIALLALSVIFSFSITLGMTLPELDKLSNTETEHLFAHYQAELPIIINILGLQENLFDTLEAYKNGKISKEEYLARINQINSGVISIIPSCIEKYEKATGKFKSILQPVLNYRKSMVTHCPSVNNVLIINRNGAKIKNIEDTFYKEYIPTKPAAIALFLQSIEFFSRISGLSSNKSESVQIQSKKATDYITPDELGFPSNVPGFVNFLCNICDSLELQEYCCPIIEARLSALQKILKTFESYKNAVTKTDLFEETNTSVNSLSMRNGSWQMKPFKTFEGYYVGYILGTLSKNHNEYSALALASMPLLNSTNEEVKKIANLAHTKSKFDQSMDHYIRLVKLSENLTNTFPVIDQFCEAYKQSKGPQGNLFAQKIQLFPASLINFINNIIVAHDVLNKTNPFGSFADAVKHCVEITKTFTEDYKKNKDVYDKNYKRLKLTLRRPEIQREGTQQRNRFNKNYLAISDLNSHSLKTSKFILSQDEIKLLTYYMPQSETKTIETPKDLPQSSVKNISPDIPQKKKKKNRKKKSNNSDATGSTLNESQPETINVDPSIEKKQQQSNPNNIFVLDKKIAKKINDEKNAMEIHIFRLKDTDKSAPKIMNYDNRVQRWFSNPKEALAEKDFKDNDPRKLNSEVFHTFSKEVDKYALKWGFKRSARNKDNKGVTEILLPGVIDKNGKRYEGLFVYVIDSKYFCYHRFFKECDWRNKLATEWSITIDE